MSVPPEHPPACFGMRMADGHGVRPQEISLLCLGRHLGDGHGTRPWLFCPRFLS